MFLRVCYSLLIQVLMIIGLFSCKQTDLEAEQTPLVGKVLYVSPLFSSPTPILLARQPVTVTDLLLGTVYPLVTDTLGLFALPGMSVSGQYSLETKLTRQDSDEYKVVYSATQTVTGSQLKNVTLTATIDTIRYKALVISVADELGGKIPGSNVLLYTSRVIAKADTGYAGDAALANLTTNETGKCLLMQLPSDSIFIKSQFKIDKKITLRSPVITSLKITAPLTITTITVR